MINAMYGQGFDYRWALVDKFSVCAISDDPDAAVRRLIDQVKTGGSKQTCSEIKAALALLPGAEKADFLVTYNYLRLFKVFTAFMPVPMPQLDIPTKSNFNIAGKVGDGKLVVDVALPKEHLTEIMSMFMMMQQQMMQQQMQQQQQMQPQSPAPQVE